MSRVGILSFSDGREFVHHGIASFVADVEARIATACAASGHEVIRAIEPITSSEVAVAEGRRLAAKRPDLTIFNYPVWGFPHFTVHAARATGSPLLLFSNIDPAYPGMVAMLAAGGSLDQLGRRHERLWGDVEVGARDTRDAKSAMHSHLIASRRRMRRAFDASALHGQVIG